MRNFITAVFDSKTKAYEGLHALWQLDHAGEITVHGTAVVHRDAFGRFQVDTKETHPAMATAFGVGIGALLGALAGPVGIAVGVAAGAGIGAAAGGTIGVAADLMRADTRNEAEYEAGTVIDIGQSAVIADVSEDWTSPVDTTVRRLGGQIFRRAKSALRQDGWFDDGYLYPYEYVPPGDTLWSI
jgi:uncharacterized membrane protein